MGASRRQHHRQEEGMRAATAEANRQRAIMEQQQRAFQEQLAAQRQAMLEQTEAMRGAQTTKILSTLEAGNVGIRTARSTRGTTAGLARGVASLRIPLNVGGTSGSGLNIG